MVTEIELFESDSLSSFFPLRCLFFFSWMKREVYKRKVETRDDLLARILDVAAHPRECKDKI
jgi:hypothetical protein